MKVLFSIFVLMALDHANAAKLQSGFNIEEAKKRCLKHFSQSPEVMAEEFQWGYTFLEMEDKFEEIYDSGKRLYMHSIYKEQEDQFYIFHGFNEISPVPITENFIKSVTTQIEVALEKGMASFVFFPDMGHSHLYFPIEHWVAEYTGDNEPKGEKANLYAKMLADPKMKALYHLSEQLKTMETVRGPLLNDEFLLFKYWNRNFVGFNDGSRNFQIEIDHSGRLGNAASKMEGHEKYSGGFALSASVDGCFPYIDKDGVTRYFDIGLQDPRYDPNIIDPAEG